ncbi:MAG: spore germination protein [Clostridia bacterium]|nr:spore germination protein [Clostridia bacterium]
MEVLSKNLQENLDEFKRLLPAEDVLNFEFLTGDGTKCVAVFIDGITDKALLGELVAKPLGMYEGKATFDEIKKRLASPENKEENKLSALQEEVLDGNAVLLVDGCERALVLGLKTVPVRAITEPPTDIAIKGPRAGFVEDLKTNMALLRTRLKTPDLLFESLTLGKQSATNVALCYIKGIAKEDVVDEVQRVLNKIEVDGVCDSSYISLFLAKRRHSLFKQSGTCEKPDILAAKMLEGRVGILVDGSPIALSVPYLIVEDFQSSEDYFVSPYRATFSRFIRALSLILAIYLPAFYVAAQLFKLQLLPIGLLLTIASSIQGLPLSPSMEMFLTLLALEVITEASVRMPKYVGTALSVVAALVLGDTAVNAGFLSTTAILIVALSGICLYTVPNLVESNSLIRMLMLLAAGSVGTYGIILLTAFILYYLFSAESYSSPLLAPFAPVVKRDLKDALVKFNTEQLPRRPVVVRGENQTRLKQ